MEIIKTKNGERYKEKVRLDTGKLITKTFRRKTDALAWKRKVETEKAQGLLGSHSIKSATFDAVAIKWFESKVEHSLAYKTVLTYRYELHSNLIPHFAGYEMSKISLSQIEDLRSKLQRKGLSPKTINRSLTVTRQVFMYAQDEGHLNEPPFKRSLLLKLKKRVFVYFEDSEIKALLRENRHNETYPILYLAIHTGMRLGEILGLCWDRVNFSSGNIEITRTLHGKGVLQEMTKSGKARYFPMNEELRSFFMALRRGQKSPIFVFTREDGSAFDPPHFSCRNFKQACIDARVRCLRFHDLRHSFASHFMMNGGNVFDLKELLGHSDMNTTMIYAHLSPGHLREASRIVNFGEFCSEVNNAGPLLALANKNG